MCNMAAVTLKLSRQDAKYLVQLLDAVSQATRDLEPTKCSTCLAIGGRLDVPCKRCDKTGFLPHSVEVKRAQSLHNASPFGDFRGTRIFALRVGATLLTSCNIADSHGEVEL